jgi:hypothetical protein
MTDEDDRALWAAEDAYRKKFHDGVTTIMLGPEAKKKATEALKEAVEKDRPFRNNEAFFEAIGMEPPDGDDTVI